VERTFTLEQSVQTAMQNNPSLLVAQGDVKIADRRVGEAFSNFLPKVDLNMTGSRYLAQEDNIVSPDLGNTLLRRSRSIEPDTFYTARIGFKQNLYNGGRMRNNVQLAKAGREQSRIKLEELRGQVVFSAVKSFYDVMLARKQKALAEEAAQRVDSFLDRTPAWDEGTRAVWEALQGRFRRNLGERRRAEQKAYLDFLNTLGLELYTQVGLAGELSSKPVELNLPRLLAQAQESRLEIRATDFQREIDALAVNLLKAERYPAVSLGGAYEYNDPKFPLRTRFWHTTLNVSLPIFDGFSSRFRLRQTRLQMDQNRVLQGQVQDRINTEVRDAHGDAVYWQEEMALRAAEMGRARQALKDLERSRNIPARAQVESWALESSQAYWESVHGHRVALAKLEKAVGRPIQ
jgi:outer membrane protein TolC